MRSGETPYFLRPTETIAAIIPAQHIPPAYTNVNLILLLRSASAVSLLKLLSVIT